MTTPKNLSTKSKTAVGLCLSAVLLLAPLTMTSASSESDQAEVLTVEEFNERLTERGVLQEIDPASATTEWRSEIHENGDVVNVFGVGLSQIPISTTATSFTASGPEAVPSANMNSAVTAKLDAAATAVAASQELDNQDINLLANQWACWVAQDAAVTMEIGILHFGVATTCDGVADHRARGMIQRSSWSHWRNWLPEDDVWNWTANRNKAGWIALGTCNPPGTYDYRGKVRSEVHDSDGQFHASPWYYSWVDEREDCGGSAG